MNQTSIYNVVSLFFLSICFEALLVSILIIFLSICWATILGSIVEIVYSDAVKILLCPYALKLSLSLCLETYSSPSQNLK